MIWKLAWRNLARNRWRTVLTAAGLATAIGLMIFVTGLMGGVFGQMVRGATALDTGQVLIERQDYADEPAIYEAFDLEGGQLDDIEQVDGVRKVAPRVNLYGLLGNEQRSQVAELLGVDPRREASATPIAEALVEGRWLSEQPEPPPAPRELVLGDRLARQLEVDVGDELVAFLEASDGSLGNDLFEVVGVVHTGNSAVDRQGAYVPLEDAQYMGALDGQVHEIIVKADDPAAELDPLLGGLQPVVAELSADDYDVQARSWKDARPEVAQMLEMSGMSSWIMYLIVYLVAGLGLLNTQRMSALERRREFAVMQAIGVSPGRLFAVVVAESVCLSLVGGAIGALFGGGLTWYWSAYGLDMGSLYGSAGSSFSFQGVSFAERLYLTFGVDSVLVPLGVMLLVALVCGLWPALKATRIDISSSIAGRN